MNMPLFIKIICKFNKYMRILSYKIHKNKKKITIKKTNEGYELGESP